MYQSQTNGQSKRVNQVIEDMLRSCIVHFGGSWRKFFSYVEFTYNNCFQIKNSRAPYGALYGQQCSTLVAWEESRGVTTPSSKIVLQEQGVVEFVGWR